MAKGLKSFLGDWDETHPEDVVVIDEPVSVKYGVAALQHKLESQGLFPVIVCQHPITVEGKTSPFPLVCNLLASRRRCAESIGTRPERVAMDYVKTISARMKPVLVTNGDAPVKEVIERNRIDLKNFPVPIHHENTSGKEITGSYITTVDPETSIDNTACQRGEPISDTSMSMFIGGGSHNARNIASWWAQGKDAPVAMWIGHHPAACIGGQVKLGHPESHWEAMGGLLREPAGRADLARLCLEYRAAEQRLQAPQPPIARPCRPLRYCRANISSTPPMASPISPERSKWRAAARLRKRSSSTPAGLKLAAAPAR